MADRIRERHFPTSSPVGAIGAGREKPPGLRDVTSLKTEQPRGPTPEIPDGQVGASRELRLHLRHRPQRDRAHQRCPLERSRIRAGLEQHANGVEPAVVRRDAERGFFVGGH